MARILILSSEFPPFHGGISTYALKLADAAAADGHAVTVVAPDQYADQAAADSSLPFTVRRYADGPATFRGVGKRIAATRAALKAGPFDIVHAADYPFFLPVALLARRRSTRRLFTLHGTEVLYMRSIKRRGPLDLLRCWRRGFVEWIGNSRYTTELALKTFPIAREDSRAVPLGVSQDWFDAPVAPDVARARYGIGADDFVIASLGRVVPRKGHLVLARALAALPDALQRRIRWWIVGPHIDPAHAEAINAATSGLSSKTELLGALPFDQVRERLSASNLFCLPGYVDEGGAVEGFGLVFLEAAARGVPSVATLSGGIPDAIRDGETGLLVPERDPVALASAIAALMTDPARLGAMAAAAYDHARQSTWTDVMRETYRLGPVAERG